MGAWGAFHGAGAVVPAQKLVWDGEKGVPHEELGESCWKLLMCCS